MDERILYDEEDKELVLSHRWSLKHSSSKQKKTFYYARTYIDGKSITMHRLIMGNPIDMEIDHINHDTLDNRRGNLRIVTHKENMANRKPNAYSESLTIKNKSGFRGVHWDKERRRWRAYIVKNGKNVQLGRFDNILEAAEAYKKANVLYNSH